MAFLQPILRKASEIAAMVQLKTDEVVAVNYWTSEIQFHLKPLPLARVFRLLGVPKHRLEVTRSEEGDVHLNFSARGAKWTAVVLNKEYRSQDWQDLLGGGAPARIAQAPLALTFDSSRNV